MRHFERHIAAHRLGRHELPHHLLQHSNLLLQVLLLLCVLLLHFKHFSFSYFFYVHGYIFFASLSSKDFPLGVTARPLWTPFAVCLMSPSFSSCWSMTLIILPEPS